MSTQASFRSVVVALLLVILALPACGRFGPAISKSDRLIPGELIVSRDEDRALHIVAADGSSARRLVEHGSFGGPVVSPDGRSVAAISTNSQPVVIVDIATGGLLPVKPPGGSYHSPVWSPTGAALAFLGVDYARFDTSRSAGFYSDQVFIADADGTRVHLLLSSDDDGMKSPTWSPDGTRIAWVDRAGVWITGADGSARRQLVADTQVFELSWSPVGNDIILTRLGNRGYLEAHLIDAESGEQRVIDANGYQIWHPAWSPDGRWIAFSGQDLDGSKLVIVSLDGLERVEIPLSKGVDFMRWSPNSMWIAFSSVNTKGEGVIPSIHPSMIDPFSEQPRVHTLLRDLAYSHGFDWRPATQ